MLHELQCFTSKVRPNSSRKCLALQITIFGGGCAGLLVCFSVVYELVCIKVYQRRNGNILREHENNELNPNPHRLQNEVIPTEGPIRPPQILAYRHSNIIQNVSINSKWYFNIIRSVSKLPLLLFLLLLLLFLLTKIFIVITNVIITAYAVIIINILARYVDKSFFL